MENGVDAEARREDELGRGLEDVMKTTEGLELEVNVEIEGDKMHEVHVELGDDGHGHLEREDDYERADSGARESVAGCHDTMLMNSREGITSEHLEADPMVEEDHIGLDEDTRLSRGEACKGQDNKIYKEGPWDVLEMLVLVAAMKECAETVGVHPQEDHINEHEKWHYIENYSWGQLVQRSALDCHEKWALLSAEFKRVKDFESNMVQDQKSYWEMTYDERNSAHLPGDFSQEVYNSLWQWDDRDRIGEVALSLEDETNIKRQSLFGTMIRTRKRADRAESQVSGKVSRGEGSMEPTFLGSQLMMFGTQQGSLALVEASEEVQPSVDNEVWNAQLAQLRANQYFWAPHGRASATWAFYVVNDNSVPDSARPQQMRCAICHPAQQDHRPNSATRVRKGVVTYNKQHGTTSMKKHVAQEHGDIFTKYKAIRKPSGMTRTLGQHARRMKKDPSPSLLTDFLSIQNPCKKCDPAQERLLEDLVLYVAKSCHPISIVENVWLKRLVMKQCGRVNSLGGRQLADEVVPRIFSQTVEKFILPALAGCATATATFDLWMSRRGVNTIALVIHFIDDSWVPCSVTVGVFEAPDTAGGELAMEVKDLLRSFNLTDKIIAFVMDDDDSRLGSLTSALSSTVLCAPLQLTEPYAGTCFGHVLSKACDYATTDEKACSGMRVVSIDASISTLKKTISWTNRSVKRRDEWVKACGDIGIPPRRLRAPIKGRFASKVIFLQESLDFHHALSLCFPPRGNDIYSQVPSVETWAVAKAVTDALTPVLRQCVKNQSKGYWLLSDAIATALGLCIQLHKEVIDRGLADPKLEAGNFESELEVLQARIMTEVMGALAPVLSFTVTYSARHAHNMLALMLDPRYKGLSLVKDYVGREMALQVVAETDASALLPCLVTVFKLLNPSSAESASALSPSKDSFDENSLFGSTASNEEAIVGHLKAELSLFRRLHIDPKECDNPLAWWKDHEVQFPNVGFLARQILGIVGSQVEIERIFSVVGVITAVRRRHLGIDNVNKLVLIRENWPDDLSACRKIVEAGMQSYFVAEDNILEDNEDLVMEAGLFEG